jgi:hypothetical protein
VGGRLRRRVVVALAALAVLATTACGDGDDDEAADAGDSVTTVAADREPTVVRGAGDITEAVDEFRQLLGPDNGGEPNGSANGRREINWDGVPDEAARPNRFPADFFDADQAPRARGAVLETPGESLGVSADAANPSGAAPRFGDINPGYTEQFKTFSAERLFSPIGSNVVDLTFHVPGTDTPGVVRGFGAVYTDVDRAENTAFEYFDADGESLGQFAVPVSEDGLSFLGVSFPEAVVARVRIEYGSDPLGPDDGPQYDVAVMDDFIYGEPQAGA